MYRILCVVYNIVSSTLYLLFCVGRNANAKLSLSLVPYRMYQQVFSRCSSPVGNIKYFFFIQKQSHEVEQQCVFSLMTSYLRLGYDLSDQSSFTSFPFPSFGFVSPFNNFWMNQHPPKTRLKVFGESGISSVLTVERVATGALFVSIKGSGALVIG